MATENDRVMKGQIREWADLIFWAGVTAPQIKPPTALSLGVARLLGAAIPLGYLQMTEPDSFTKLRGEVLSSFQIWSSDGGRLSFDPALAEQKLDIFLINVEMLSSLPETGLAALGKHWADALIDSWSPSGFESAVLNQRHQTLMTMFAGGFQHVAQELQ